MPPLKVTVGKRDRLDQYTRRRIKAAQEGKDVDDAQPVLNFDSYAELGRLLSQKNLELLETIFEYEPESIREAAELVDRDDKQVHRNLPELEGIDVIDSLATIPVGPKAGAGLRRSRNRRVRSPDQKMPSVQQRRERAGKSEDGCLRRS